jgi:hypothetical protein
VVGWCIQSDLPQHSQVSQLSQLSRVYRTRRLTGCAMNESEAWPHNQWRHQDGERQRSASPLEERFNYCSELLAAASIFNSRLNE